MKPGKISKHASVRMTQRGIPLLALEKLLEYGTYEYDHHGGKIVYLSSSGKNRLSKILAPSQIDRWANMYAVLDVWDEVITVGHRTRRIIRH